MTRKERCELAIEYGFTYNPITGDIISKFNNIIKGETYGYISFRVSNNSKRYRIFAHQFAWYVINGEIVDIIDHINGIKNDNRIINLRPVTHQQNLFNQKKVKGYYYDKNRNKFCSQIMLNKKGHHLGYFNTEQEARQAYLDAKKVYHII